MSQDATKPKLAYPIEVAFDQLGVSRTRGYQLINGGMLRTYKDGKRRLCSHVALVECQQSMERASTEGKRNAAAA
ncbi:hypothetical protein [Stenotrophomonas rhizophila]|jgi:hypothetical protein|uniref:hypothetical protein n=1 Tax=Stenotrophomonas rhizophila TaxID=216778 RepID=UPI002169CFD4|nr:hypothetical protein [Stenotrophomonas rhizophila]